MVLRKLSLQFFVALMAIFAIAYAEEPWGKDSSLVLKYDDTTQSPFHSQGIFAFVSEKAIRFHRTVISPADGPRSHFRPTSSQYMLGAIKKYGFFSGFFLGCDRLLRENNDPWIYPLVFDQGCRFKWDPP